MGECLAGLAGRTPIRRRIWLVVPSFVIWRLGKDIARSLSVAAAVKAQ